MARGLHCKEQNNYKHTCWQPAVFGVYWVQTGSDMRPCCAQHLPKAVRGMRREINGGAEKVFKIVVLED